MRPTTSAHNWGQVKWNHVGSHLSNLEKHTHGWSHYSTPYIRGEGGYLCACFKVMDYSSFLIFIYGLSKCILKSYCGQAGLHKSEKQYWLCHYCHVSSPSHCPSNETHRSEPHSSRLWNPSQVPTYHHSFVFACQIIISISQTQAKH